MAETHIAGGMAHEIRNTLGAAKLRIGDCQAGPILMESNQCLLSLVKELNEWGETTPEVKKQLLTIFRSLNTYHNGFTKTFREIDRAVDRGLAVTNRMAAYAGLQVQSAYDRVDIATIVDALCETYQDGFRDHGITIEKEIENESSCQETVQRP